MKNNRTILLLMLALLFLVVYGYSKGKKSVPSKNNNPTPTMQIINSEHNNIETIATINTETSIITPFIGVGIASK